jgi:hypothetical protein
MASQWNVWHGEQKPWTEWGNLSGRFGTFAQNENKARETADR